MDMAITRLKSTAGADRNLSPENIVDGGALTGCSPPPATVDRRCTASALLASFWFMYMLQVFIHEPARLSVGHSKYMVDGSDRSPYVTEKHRFARKVPISVVKSLVEKIEDFKTSAVDSKSETLKI